MITAYMWELRVKENTKIKLSRTELCKRSEQVVLVLVEAYNIYRDNKEDIFRIIYIQVKSKTANISHYHRLRFGTYNIVSTISQ